MNSKQSEKLYQLLEQRVVALAKSVGAEIAPRITVQQGEQPVYLNHSLFMGILDQIPYESNDISMKLPKGPDYIDHLSARGVEYEVLLRRAIFPENVINESLSKAEEAFHWLNKYGARSYSSAILTRRLIADEDITYSIENYDEPVLLLAKVRVVDSRDKSVVRVSRPLIVGPTENMIHINQWEKDNSQCFQDGRVFKIGLGPLGRTTFSYQRRIEPRF